MKKSAKIIIGIIIFAVAVAAAFGIPYLVRYINYERATAAIIVQDVDLTTISDGEYFGFVDVDFISVKVRVVVESHRITELELLEHHNSRGDAANVIVDYILAEQRINVDAISGATQSSLVIKEAIYNALTGNRTIPQ